MKHIKLLIFGILLLAAAHSQTGGNPMNFRNLTPEEERVIVHKGTERPFTGKYLKNKEKGVYTCKRCGNELYRSEDKFESGCGWPSFDDEIKGAVKRVPDADGMRVEIVCARCDGHLGHVFTGEGFTDKNTRHCVNSISMVFQSAAEKARPRTEIAVFAAGCFWGVEALMKNTPGVLNTTVGYTGGHMENPDYRSVCTGQTGHYEALKIEFNPDLVSFAELTKLFFEIHDFSQQNGQGPDIGDQYLSAIFYQNDSQQKTAEEIIRILMDKNHKVATRILPAARFYDAEDYHQDYYQKTGKKPYCHIRRKIF